MKKIVSALIITILMLFQLTGCGESKNKQEIVVFAAASMTESLTEISEVYKNENPDIELIFNFDSSGTLKTQIEEGAVCDVFISASQTPMDSLDCVLENSRFDILENKIALVVPESNPKNITSFDDMVQLLNLGDIFMAIGNADVPVGEYTIKIFNYYDLNEDELNSNKCLTYGSNVKEVTTQVSEGLVDCGLVYETDANSANLEVVDTANKEMCGQVIYPAAVLDNSNCERESLEFLDFLKSDDASHIFIKYGFTPLS